jgi:hypothetical protein
MNSKTHAAQAPPPIQTHAAGLDIVVPFTNRQLTRAALAAAGRLSSGLQPMIRMVRILVVPYPLQLEASPVSAGVLRQQLAPLAAEFRAHVQICCARDSRDGLRYSISKDSVILIAVRRSDSWMRWWPSREERLASWLRRHGYFVMLEFVEKNNA